MELMMVSGGKRARSGPAPDPNSYRSLDKDWVELPSAGWDGSVPVWPLYGQSAYESSMWVELWAKPQAAAWSALGLERQVAAYVRAFEESTAEKATSGLKTAVLRMETELGISVAGMHQNGWRIGSGESSAPSQAAPARQTSTGSWLKDVSVEGA